MPRQQERIPYLNEITLEWSSGKREARIADLSTGGCYVDTIATVPEGESISFVLRSPSGESMKFTGTVVYVLPSMGFGIAFADMTEAKAAFLVRLIAAA